ncbi:glycosyltransferase [Algisphaera agarilytica]|uniref:Glycosyltransferase involved in cell wall biosynthesis n=1 Tax=Algisphaera agarilytica TaxID=1385975 RepID=A0A7X0LL27_9BACT|nr:glycosyltransferase [Algisphaera agarilytica]MBB6430562.1 glycosyltransferase involved in cell wall biosynthesis [Algisphaera agarilytica]
MKILQCHNLYQLAGGEDSVVNDERELLESQGHEVVQYTLHNDAVEDLSRVRLAAGTIWSRKSARELRELCRREKPDIAHFHNTLPLMSPSSYHAVRAEGVPAVQTLHNYRLLCPKATFFRDNQICEKCLDKKVKWPAIQHGCYRDSRSASAAVAAMLTIHGTMGTYENQIDAYIACSTFTRDKMIEGGYPADRIHYKPNFLAADPGMGSGNGGYAMYLGRLSPEKGIEVLVKAWDQLPNVPLRVVGKGPLQAQIESLNDRHDAVTYYDWVSFPQLGQLLGDAMFLVLPSMNYEGFPRVIVEAFAHGVPVVASNIGAMGRVIEDGANGRHVNYGDADDLARVIRELMDDPEQVQRLRQGARESYEQFYTAETNYQTMMSIYRKASEQFKQSPQHQAKTAASGQTQAVV